MTVLDAPRPALPAVRDGAGRLPRAALGLLLAALAWGLLRKGAFYEADGLVLLALLTTSAVAAVTQRPSRAVLHAGGALLALTGWWWVDATWRGIPDLASPFAVSVLCLVLALTAASGLAPAAAAWLRQAVVVAGCCYALVGLIGLALRDYPLTIRSQGLYRLAGTMTYANASGALLALVLLVVLRERPAGRWASPAVALLTAALTATMCRSAVLALVVVLALTRRGLLTHLPSLVLGAGAGLLCVATASRPGAQPLLLVGVAAACAVASRDLPRRWLLAGGSVLGLLAVPLGLGVALNRRVAPEHVDDRLPEWRAAWRAFESSPWLGTGPERHLFLPSGDVARFVHNEPLQVLASAGLVGLAVLLVAGLAVFRVARAHGNGAVLGLFALAACFDFFAHVPALTTLVGLLVGTTQKEGTCSASRTAPAPSSPAVPPSSSES